MKSAMYSSEWATRTRIHSRDKRYYPGLNTPAA